MRSIVTAAVVCLALGGCSTVCGFLGRWFFPDGRSPASTYRGEPAPQPIATPRPASEPGAATSAVQVQAPSVTAHVADVSLSALNEPAVRTDLPSPAAMRRSSRPSVSAGHKPAKRADGAAAPFDRSVPFVFPGAFTANEPGEFPPGLRQTGVRDQTLHAPGMAFPIVDAPAFVGPVQHRVRMMAKLSTDPCAKDMYSYPWRDTFCEPEHNGTGAGCAPGARRGLHDGEDISAGNVASCQYHRRQWKAGKKANLIKVVAVDDGVIEWAADGKVRLVSGKTTFIYLHMNDDGLLVKRRDRVRRGQHIGYMWNQYTTVTLHHLHFEIRRAMGTGNQQPVSPYTSLVSAYRSQLAAAGHR